MAKLYFRHGAMGSSKTANALMVEYNYFERGKKPLLLKPGLDSRDGKRMIRSRNGLESKCSFVEDLLAMSDDEIKKYDCVIVDEAQFCKKEDITFFLHIVDELQIPVLCYGLRTDFQRELFEGAAWLLAWADVIEEIKTVCWCGQGANCNIRFQEDGTVIRVGEQVCLGGSDKYTALCRKHYKEGNLGPDWQKTTFEINETASQEARTAFVEEENSSLDEIDVLEPLLLEFLDAESYEERLNILTALQHKITDDMINTMAIVMDVEIPEGEVEERYSSLRNCLQTLQKYECSRIR